MTDPKPRYKDSSMQKVYVACLALAADRGSEMYNKDGSQHRGANVRIAFWDGFNDAPKGKLIPQGTMLMAAYQAGKAFAKLQKAAAGATAVKT